MQNKALVVDDSRVARMSLKKAILTQEFDVVEFASAEDVLSHLQNTNDKPNVIFMDLMMEGMDGITATKQIKMMEGLSDIPIVICSGNSSEIDINTAKTAGAMALISKPPEPSAVANILQQITQTVDVSKTSSPTDERVTPTDKSAMTDKIVQLIEQQLMTKMKQDLVQSAEEISRKTVTEMVNNRLAEQVQNQLAASLPALSAQLASDLSQLNQEKSEQAVINAIEQYLPQAIESATANLNSHIEKGLTQQQHVVQQRMIDEVQQVATQATERYINDSLAAMIAPLVTQQVEQQIQPQKMHADEQLQILSSRISKLDRIVMGLGIAVGVLAVLTFL